ncbi:MAG: hypothetical protein HY518_00110 [Candidatus Aenigmarchaeota archaeon]|nr:hypothetical protein [Candidatus Aenigmarchaeota archaeon]
MRKFGNPSYGELVVCQIVKLHPNSAVAKMVEYNKTGLIHVSEVVSRWVRDIREFLKENQYVVCKVVGIEGDTVSLSMKRVHPTEGERKLNELKKERKAEKMLELAAKALGKDLEGAYADVGRQILEEFGTLTKLFDFALKNPGLVRERLPKKWVDAIIEVAEKSIADKTYSVTAELKLICYRPDGIEVIKSVLTKARAGQKDLEIKYISTPVFTISLKGKNYKTLEARITETAEEIVKEMKQNHGEGSYTVKE